LTAHGEPAKINQAVGNQLTWSDGGNPGNWKKNPSSTGNFDDEAGSSGWEGCSVSH